jgi:ketosteroid isomerase-like protein
MRQFVFLCGLLFFIGIHASQMAFAKGKNIEAREAIARANKKFEAAHLRGDAAAIAAQYTEDGQLLWEDREIIQGREAIEAEWRKDMGGPGRKATVTSLEVEQHGDWAFERGKFVVTSPDGKTIYNGKYICIWKRVNGEWKIHRDMGTKMLRRSERGRSIFLAITVGISGFASDDIAAAVEFEGATVEQGVF